MGCKRILKTQLSTQPYFNLEVKEDQDFKKLLFALAVIFIFIYYHRQTFLTLADNLNQCFNFLKAIKLTWLHWRYLLSCTLNPFIYIPG